MDSRKTRLVNWFVGGFFVLAFLGFIDSGYLTLKHYNGAHITCSLSGGCDIVTGSVYSVFYGIPVALFGVLYYLLVLFGLVLYVDRRNEKIVRYISFFTFAGLFVSTYFVFLQLFVLNAICQYCMFSAFTSYSLFGVGMFYLKRRA